MKRFWNKVKINLFGCWEWTASRNVRYGYGQFMYRGRPTRAHRMAWRLKRGSIPDGLWVLHKCDNPACVRLSHLFLGDQKANMSDASRKGRMSKGTDRYNAKLSEKDIPVIRKMYAKGQYFQKELADLYGVSQVSIHQVISKRTWKHVP